MKRIALTVISVCLVLASVFGFIAAGSGMDDITDILRQPICATTISVTR